jgi:phage terminase small subunit
MTRMEQNDPMAVTRAQQKFVNFYIENDFRNATNAYMKAYPKASYETARRNASILLTKTDIQEYLSDAIASAIGREKLTLEKRVSDYWMKRAFYDITEIIDLNGNIKITEEELREKRLDVCIDSINKKVDGKGRQVVSYKFADRDRSVEMLQKYIQMIHEKTEVDFINPEVRATLEAVFMAASPGVAS